MAKNKTTETTENVDEFLSLVLDDQKQKDSYDLISLMEEMTGFPPKMWGPSIIGFGQYHYRYNSGHEGDAPLIGFSPRKAAISLYVFTGLEQHQYLLEGFGKYKIGKACIYIKKLSDVNETKLRAMIQESIQFLKTTYPETK